MARSITVENISKQFKISRHGNDSLRSDLQRVLRLQIDRKVTFNALDQVSFNVEEGEFFGVIGVNGSGKSTLLKILSKIMLPSAGRIELYGKINTLLEVGTGFHPELTGRENIFLNGSILGLKRSEIRAKFDAIVDFSEVEDFLETPVKHYSSGMFVRLAFAVAAHLDPDILIVDEVLSVGDWAFQQKCIRKMEDEILQGRTILFVSHNMEQVQRLCNRVLLLHQGKCHTIGLPAETIDIYLNTIIGSEKSIFQKADYRRGSGVIRFTKIEILNKLGKECSILAAGDHMVFRLYYQGDLRQLEGVNFRILIRNNQGLVILALVSSLWLPVMTTFEGEGWVDCVLEKLPLNIGRFSADIDVSYHYELSDLVTDAVFFEVVKGPFYPSGDLPEITFPILADYQWKLPTQQGFR